ncbi:MAG TPA: DUF3052 family protein [Polyangia bacterium]|nr:DUF3052 family protein [Polyangia bacterium]
MAGYSGTPLPKKLGIKPAARLALVNAPADFAETLGELPPGVTPQALLRGPYDVVVLFARDDRDLALGLPAARARLDAAGGLWVAWPKKSSRKASGIETDITEQAVRARGLALGLVDNKVCAIDDTWSGLRFVVRLADRPKVGSARPARAKK